MRKSILALLLAATSIAVIAATPADAKARHQAVPRDPFNQLQLPGDAISPANDPTGVYRNGRLIGRDPDPSIRLQIEQYYGRGAAS
jgi:hypothetical protein